MYILRTSILGRVVVAISHFPRLWTCAHRRAATTQMRWMARQESTRHEIYSTFYTLPVHRRRYIIRVVSFVVRRCYNYIDPLDRVYFRKRTTTNWKTQSINEKKKRKKYDEYPLGGTNVASYISIKNIKS